ncbi:MAG: carboxylating nicotinate-nucleotide diphosphorylase [Ignavibacteria bacterium]
MFQRKKHCMTIKEYYKKHSGDITDTIKLALKEDEFKNDVTTNLLLKGALGDKKFKAAVLCKEDCVLAGLDIFVRVYKLIDPKARFKAFSKDGRSIKKGKKILEITASRRTLLEGERTALNILQRMSGIATFTNCFVKLLKSKGAKILHTRKTTPGFRLFEAAAVKTGGGDFHRLSLAGAVMIKDNHIEAFGGIENVMGYLVRKNISYKLKQKFEIEVKTFKELEIVVKYGKGLVEIVMLDNFKPGNIDRAIKILKNNGFKIELSGGINMRNFGRYQRKGVDFYSIGALTHSYKSSDFSLEF